MPSCLSLFISLNLCSREQLRLTVLFLQQVLQLETQAISKLGNVLKKDMRDVEMIMSEGATDMIVDGVQRQTLKRL